MLAALRTLPRRDRPAACLLPQPDRRRSRAGAVEQVLAVVKERGLVPFLDIAYQGFADSLDADAAAVRRFARNATWRSSRARSPSALAVRRARRRGQRRHRHLRGGRARAVADEARDPQQLLQPSTHGGQTVATVLNTPELRTMWEKELGEMRDRIKLMRASSSKRSGPSARTSTSVRGKAARDVLVLRAHQGPGRRAPQGLLVYAIDSGRICVAALNSRNIDHVAKAVAEVLVKVPAR